MSRSREYGGDRMAGERRVVARREVVRARVRAAALLAGRRRRQEAEGDGRQVRQLGVAGRRQRSDELGRAGEGPGRLDSVPVDLAEGGSGATDPDAAAQIRAIRPHVVHGHSGVWYKSSLAARAVLPILPAHRAAPESPSRRIARAPPWTGRPGGA